MNLKIFPNLKDSMKFSSFSWLNTESYCLVMLNNDTGIPVIICQLTQSINQVLEAKYV